MFTRIWHATARVEESLYGVDGEHAVFGHSCEGHKWMTEADKQRVKINVWKRRTSELKREI